MRERSERHLIETRTLCDLLYLRQALESYQKRQQKQVQKLPAPDASASPLPNKPKLPTPVLKPFPASLQELVKVGLIPRVPLDFWGRPYLYQPKTGRVPVQPFSWEVYDRELTPYPPTRLVLSGKSL